MSKSDNSKDSIKVVATNRKAHFNYQILETLEAGILLTGPEVKSLRDGKANLQDGFARIENDIPYLMNVNISPYAFGSLHVVQEPSRRRILLMNKSEIRKWASKAILQGLTIVPLEIYFNKGGYAKVKLGLGKGKKGPDRREDIKKKTLKREMQRDFSGKHRVR